MLYFIYQKYLNLLNKNRIFKGNDELIKKYKKKLEDINKFEIQKFNIKKKKKVYLDEF
jgi:hypothetical protein